MTGLEDIWDDNHLPPFYGTPRQLMELGEVVGKCIDSCKASSNIREIVIETWITIDFTIRQLLLSGFNLTRYSNQDFDIGYLLFPNNFIELVNILENTRKYLKEHGTRVIPEKADKDGGFTTSISFWKFLKENNPELLSQIVEITKEYRRKMSPGLADTEEVYYFEKSSSQLESGNKPFEEFDGQWKEVICNLEDNWFDRIRQLNKARNVAAHIYDAKRIARCFGKTEPNLADKIKSECFSLLHDLLNIKSQDI